MKRAVRSKHVVVPISAAIALAMVAAVRAASDPRFDRLDANRDGFITTQEIEKEPGYAKTFAGADDNGDGRLSPDEFIKADSMRERAKAGDYIDDSIVTAKVKAALFKQAKMDALDVSVKTTQGEVLLSGVVKSEAQRREALKAAASIEGVRRVKDELKVGAN